ncbi:MAG: FHA domain-containing protein [Methylotenera sp.]|nr:FHA domain-containing protein [Methylotenera sp.]
MAKLIFSLDDTMIREYLLKKERMTIGRKPTNDIHIDYLAASGEHAAILKKGDDFYIEDQGSTNGTQVNDKLVKSHLLQTGDLIQFGKYTLKYVNEDASQQFSRDGAAFEQTIMVRPAAMKALLESSSKDVSASAQVSEMLTRPSINAAANTTENPQAIAIGRIQVLNGTSAGRQLVLNKTMTTLGKAGSQVVVITKRPNGYFLTHVEGKALPIVNGASIGAQAFALNEHDVIELGGIKMEFYLDKP